MSAAPGLDVCIVAYKNLGLNTRVARQATALVERGHRVTVVAFAPPDLDLFEGLKHCRFLSTGVPRTPGTVFRLSRVSRYLPGPVAGSLHAAAARLLSSRGELRCQRFGRRACGLLAGQPFDIVQAHHEKALIAADMIRRQCGGRLLYDIVEYPFADEMLPRAADMRALRRREVALERRIALAADGLVAVNDSVADVAAAAFGAARPAVVRNCCRAAPPGDDGRLRRDLGMAGDRRVALFLNTVREGEGLRIAIRAVSRLEQDVHLAVLGPTPDAAYLQTCREMAAACGMADRVHVLPLQPPHGLIRYIAGADCGIVPRRGDLLNRRYSLPNRVFEMVAARLPMAVSALPEIAALVERHGIGTVFDPTDADDAARALADLLEPDRFAACREAAKAAAAELTWERESGIYLAAIESVAAA